LGMLRRTTAMPNATDEQSLVKRFADVARVYCGFIEEDTGADVRAFVSRSLNLLLSLLATVLELPDTKPAKGVVPGSVKHDEWNAVSQRIKTKLGDHDYYWMVFETLQTETPEPIRGSLSDDLSDIWRDLKNGLFVLDSGEQKAAATAAWHWRFLSETHWGCFHATPAIRALHSLLVGPLSPR
jgi:Domain of unknown function (DUF5063)